MAYNYKESADNTIYTPFSTTKGDSSYHCHHIYHHQQNMEKNFAAIFVDELFAEPTYSYGDEEHNKAKEVGNSTSESSNKEITSLMPDVQKQKYVQVTTKKKVVAAANMARNEAAEKMDENESRTSDEAWEELRNTCKSLPRVRGVDERAEEFISKFRQDMKLEREQSLIDFQEMLARGV